MPKTWLQFTFNGAPDVQDRMRRAYIFLRDHSDFAYSTAEIASALDCRDGSSLDSALIKALDELVYLGAVDEREVDGQRYYLQADSLDEFLVGTKSRP